jgi:hypothetical protein
MRTYSRKELYALGETLGESVTTRKVGGGLILGGGGSGGGGQAQPTQTTSTSYQTNIPEYAKPYVETMLGATQNQLFQMDGGNITGFQPYKAYGGTYDASGNQTSYDPSKSVAGFSPLQQQAQQGTANLQVPGQYGQAIDATGMGIMNAANIGANANPYNFQQQVGGYMNPYLQQSLAPQIAEANRQYDIGATKQQSAATQAGAFGGSREAIMAAENERNRNMGLQNIIGQGYNNAYNQAQQQYNQNAGMQLQANNAFMQGAGQLAGLGQQQLGAQQGILGLQNQVGAQQQAYQQQIINQGMQDYANAQQYPLMQLGTMSNMLRGLPMQAQTTNQYVASPNPITQGIGAAGAAASLYNATKAEGGVIKSMASGGIASYDVGGEVYADLERMDPKELQQIAQHSDSPSMQKMARAILARSMPIQAASGGIMHFVNKGEVESTDAEDKKPLKYESLQERAERNLQERGNIYSGRKPTEEQNAAWNAKEAPPSTDEMAQRRYELRKGLDSLTSGGKGSYGTSVQTPKSTIRAEEAPPEFSAPGVVNPAYREYINRDAMRNRGEDPQAYDPKLYPVSSGITAAVPTTYPAKEQLPAGAKTPAEYDKELAGRKDLSTEQKSSMSGMYRNGYAQLQTQNKAQPITAVAPATARPVVPTTGGITQATKPVEDAVLKGLMSGIESENKIANETDEAIAARLAKEAGPNVGREKYRAEEMARKANLGDEAERQRNLRMAEIFSIWGSTPGPVLVAGMTAFKTKIPDLINDRREAKKLERESDKIIYDLDEADRLEKAGYSKEARDLKQKAKTNAQHLQTTVATYRAHMRQSDVTEKGHEMDYKAKMAGVAAHERQNTLTAEKGAEDKKWNTLSTQQTNMTSLQKEQETERKNEEYARHSRNAGIPVDSSTPETTKKLVEASKDWINKKEQEFKGQRDRINERIKAAEKRLNLDTETAGGNSVTVGGKTYTRPAGFTDEQWNAYKKDAAKGVS